MMEIFLDFFFPWGNWQAGRVGKGGGGAFLELKGLMFHVNTSFSEKWCIYRSISIYTHIYMYV